MSNRILALGSHHDDVEVGLAGTLFRHTQRGDEVYMAVLDSDEFRTGDAGIRFQEQLCALNLLGLNKKNLLCFKMNDDSNYVINELDKIKPNIVYAPFELDTHQSHRNCSYVGQSVCRKAAMHLFFYHSGSSYNFNPNIFSLIDFAVKEKLLGCFKSQIDRGVIDIEVFKRRDSYWASLITKDPKAHAEGLIVRKSLHKL